MSNVIFWSPFQRSGSTSNLISTAFMIGLSQRLRVLAMHMDYAGESMEAALPVREQNADYFMENFSTTGWDAMYRLYTSGSLTKEKFRDCTTPLIKNQLDLLPGMYRQTILDERSVNMNHVSSISKIASEAYDLILLDAGSGKEMERDIVMEADVVVVNLNQNMRELEHFFRNHEWKKEFEQKKVILTLGLYDGDSNCTLGNIKRRFGYRDPIIPVSYCTPFRDAWNRRDTGSYIHQTMNLDKKSGEMGEYATSIRELSKTIMDSAGLRSILKQLERGA